MCIKSDANKGQQYQKWLFTVREINKIGIGFLSIFLLKARVSYLTILKRKNFSTFEGWNRPVCFTRVSFCQNCISPSNSKGNCDGADAESPFLLFFSFSASFKNSSPREKIGNSLRFGTGGWSLCFYLLLSWNIWTFFPTLTMAARVKKFLAKQFARAIRVHYRDLEHAYAYWIWLRGSASYVINTYNWT